MGIVYLFIFLLTLFFNQQSGNLVTLAEATIL